MIAGQQAVYRGTPVTVLRVLNGPGKYVGAGLYKGTGVTYELKTPDGVIYVDNPTAADLVPVVSESTL